MALLNKLFGPGPKKAEGVSPQASIDKLRQTLDMLEKREAYLESKIQKELLSAKQNATKNKRGAQSCPLDLTTPSPRLMMRDLLQLKYIRFKSLHPLPIFLLLLTPHPSAAIMALKRKKAYEGQITNLNGARLTIETQVRSPFPT